jgi:hypothetical protein
MKKGRCKLLIASGREGILDIGLFSNATFHHQCIDHSHNGPFPVFSFREYKGSIRIEDL